jgi:hypothetical protein
MVNNIGKDKGNQFERHISRELSTWFFNDKGLLWRESTSGARKVDAYSGDVVPSNVEKFSKYWNMWPFIIECKSGYRQHTATLSNQTKVREWLCKLLNERIGNQIIPMLIIRFYSQPTILLTTLQLETWCNLSLALKQGGTINIFYIYLLSDLLKTDFYEIIPNDVLSKFLIEKPQRS